MELVQRYLDHLRLERNLTENSLRANRVDLSHYDLWLGQRSVDPSSATRDHVHDYLAELHDQLAASSMARRLSTLRSLHKWLVQVGICSTDPTTGLRGPRQEKTLPRMLSVDEMIALLSQPLAGADGDPGLAGQRPSAGVGAHGAGDAGGGREEVR